MSFRFCDPMDLSNRPIASLFANFRNAQLIAHTHNNMSNSKRSLYRKCYWKFTIARESLWHSVAYGRCRIRVFSINKYSTLGMIPFHSKEWEISFDWFNFRHSKISERNFGDEGLSRIWMENGQTQMQHIRSMLISALKVIRSKLFFQCIDSWLTLTLDDWVMLVFVQATIRTIQLKQTYNEKV